MIKPVRRLVPFPTKDQLRDFLREASGPLHKREIARAFHLRGDDRAELRAMLKELEAEGAIDRGARRSFAHPGALPAVAVVEVTAAAPNGKLLARPMVWREPYDPPEIFLSQESPRGGVSLKIGDRVLARLRSVGEHAYQASAIRRIGHAPSQILGVYLPHGDSGRLRPTNRREKNDYLVVPADSMEAVSGELVLAEAIPGARHHGPRRVRIVKRLGSMANPQAISLIAIHSFGIPVDFSPESIVAAEAACPAPTEGREDLRPLPLVTIDGEDARDFDDAVFAEPDPDNPGGWHVIVAIADVAWYVRPGEALDQSALERGNSVYFPDRVVPMLPEALSNGWCSLKPDEDRPCLAVHLWLDAEGTSLRHRFVRSVMRSAARLTYLQVQAARDGAADDTTAPLLESVIRPLYGAYEALLTWRRRRGTLELDLPERRVVLGEEGNVVRVDPRPRYDSHRLIEEMMIAANVAAAVQLMALGQPCMYRVHDQPSPDKLDSLREFLGTMDLKLSRGHGLTAHHLNRILKKVAGTPKASLINEVVLRSQAQAEYTPHNIGHFGLGLEHYAHFTSPIRRYADLLVHRALIAGMAFGEGALPAGTVVRFAEMGTHISATERRAASAEREVVNRYTAAFLAERVGATFTGRVNGVTRSGLFVTLDETGAEGILPMRGLGDEYFAHDEAHHSLTGRSTGRTYRLGDALVVRLAEADAITGSLTFQLERKTGPKR
ncbi:MAG: ribonuclease R [Alphaproteobacteria bacterium]